MPRLGIDLVCYYNATTLPPAPGSGPGSARVYDNHLLQAKLTYQFTRALSTRAILDYSAFAPNSSLYAGVPSQRATADLLFTWMLNPGTAFHLGYVNRDASAAIDGVLPAFSRTFSPAAPTERQLFLKLSYSFRP